MSELTITKEAVLKAAEACPEAKATLKELFPAVFATPPPPTLKLGDIVKLGDDYYLTVGVTVETTRYTHLDKAVLTNLTSPVTRHTDVNSLEKLGQTVAVRGGQVITNIVSGRQREEWVRGMKQLMYLWENGQ